MDIKIKLLYMFFDLILPLAAGYLCRRQGWLSEKFFLRLIDIAMCVAYPLLSSLTCWVLALNFELFLLPFFGVIISAIPGAAAYLRVNRKYRDDLDRGSYILSAMLSNVGTLGGLCAFILFGETGFAYTQIMMLPQNIIIFMFCFPLAQYYYQKSLHQKGSEMKISSLLFTRNQLPVAGMAFGILLRLLDIPRPEFLAGTTIDFLVHLGAWTALVPIGNQIDFSKVRQYCGQIVDLLPIKFVLTPALVYLLSSMVFTDPVIVKTLLILAATPTAINAVVAVQVNKLNMHIAMASFMLTTAVFLLAVFPILFIWLAA